MSESIEVALLKQQMDDYQRHVNGMCEMIKNQVRSALISLEEGNEDEAIATLNSLLGDSADEEAPQ